MGGLTIENNFFILKIEKRNKIIVCDFPKVGAGVQKSGGAAALPAPPPPRSLIGITELPKTHHFVVSFDRVLPFKVILNARDRVARSEKSQTEKTEDPDRESSLAIF